MNELEQLIKAYRGRRSTSVTSKLDVLLDITRLRHPGVLPFLKSILEDGSEAEEVRIYVLKQLRQAEHPVRAADRRALAMAISDLLVEPGPTDLRLQAAVSLGDFVQLSEVMSLLNDVCLAKHESIDLRYAAFTALERAGPVPKCVSLLREMSTDEVLGSTARSVLSAWHIGY
jgi:hypothetical protein